MSTLHHHSYCYGEIWRHLFYKKNDINLADLSDIEVGETNGTGPLNRKDIKLCHFNRSHDIRSKLTA